MVALARNRHMLCLAPEQGLRVRMEPIHTWLGAPRSSPLPLHRVRVLPRMKLLRIWPYHSLPASSP